MQKLLKRTAQAEKQAARRIKKRNDLVKNNTQRKEFRNRMVAVRDVNQSLADARRRRREDWEMGAIRPQRDTPIKGTNSDAFWGSLSLQRQLGTLPEKQIELACKWAGGKKYLCLKAGDRVTVIQGPDKGKIGTIRSIQEEEASVSLEGEHLMVSAFCSISRD